MTQFDQTLVELAREMLETMYAAGGVGLAAPQVNVPLAVFTMNAFPRGRRREAVVVNPVVVGRSPSTQVGVEGCLSLPGFTLRVRRPKWIHVRCQTVTGEPTDDVLQGLAARVFLHELDHLQGTLIVDRAEPEDLARAQEFMTSAAVEVG